MPKLGDQYQALVGAVESALDPGARVNVGVWVVGPDGRRDLDVEVRGTVDGKAKFVLIECKDWKEPVGIAVVDALDSKRRDLAADRAIIYSNSGFTEPALRKSSRLGIGMASALRAGDDSVKIEVHTELVAKHLSVDRVVVRLFSPTGQAPSLPQSWELGALEYERLPVQNWLAARTAAILRDDEPHGLVHFAATFRQEGAWTYAGDALAVGALQVDLHCTNGWLSQTVRQDVTLGLFDHIRGQVTIPAGQSFHLGSIDRDAWRPAEGPPDNGPLESNSFRINLTLMNPLRGIAGRGSPDLDALIVEQKVWCADQGDA